MAQSAHMGSNSSLCKHLVPLLPASKPGRAASQGLTWSPFGKGRWEAQEHEGAGEWCVLKAAQLLPESSSSCRAEGALGGAAFALPGMHGGLVAVGHLGVSQGASWCRRRKGWGYTTLSWPLSCHHRLWFRSLSSGENSWIPFLHPLVVFSLISYSKEAKAHAPVPQFDSNEPI